MPNGIVVSDFGQVRKLSDVEFAEDIIKLSKNKDHWAVVDRLVNHWAQTAPDEVEAMSINLEEYRDSQRDKQFATTAHGKNQDRRFLLSFPKKLKLMMRSIYRPQELAMDRKFYNEFARRYPFFKVAQKI